MDFYQLEKEVATHVTELFEKFQNPFLLYHNLKHTQTVVTRTLEIAESYSINGANLFVLSAAAWFHDVGQLFGPAKQHEQRSVNKMKIFLEAKKLDEDLLIKIERCILATILPHNPQSLPEEIIGDADTYHLGTTDFPATDALLKKETELRNNIEINNWDECTLRFLEEHQYFTPYCQQKLNKRKQNNIALVRSCIKESCG